MNRNRAERPDTDDLELDWGGREKRGADAPEAPPAEPLRAESLPARRTGPPGAAEGMPLDLQYALEPLLKDDGLHARQVTHWGEALLGWEQGNKYVVDGQEGRTIFLVGEEGEGLLAGLARNLWAFRTLRLEFMTPGGTRAMQLVRPWRPFFARADIEAWDGRSMGLLQQRFSLLRRRIDVLTPAGNELATIVGPVFRPWTFEVHQKGQHIATIRKQWSGFSQEAFTDSDNFGIAFHAPLDARLRQLLLAATLMIDLLWFEQRGGRRSGALGLLTD